MAEKFNILESLHEELAHRMNEKNIQSTITTLRKIRGVSESIGKKPRISILYPRIRTIYG